MAIMSMLSHQAVATPRGFAGRAVVPRIGRRQGPSRLHYKDADRPDDKTKQDFNNVRDNVRDARDSAREGYRDARDNVREAGHEARNAAENVRDNVADAARWTGRNVSDAAHQVGHDINNATSRAGDRLSESADRSGRRIEGETKTNMATVYYLTAAVVTAAWEAIKLFKPDTALTTAFRNALTARGAEIAQLTGSLASSTYLLQVFAVLGIPVVTALICQAHNSHAGHLDSDSGMRLNFGLFAHVATLLGTFFASPLRPYIGGAETVAVSAYFCLMAATVYYGVRESRRFHTLGQLTNEMTQGFISTVGRTLAPKSLVGSVYGIFAAISAFAAGHLVFGRHQFTSYFNTIAGEVTFSGAHADIVGWITGGIVANLLFAVVAFAALKELADKSALASRTARFLNIGLSSTLIGFGFILNHGTQKGIVSSQGSAIWGLASQVSAFMLLASIVFVLYPKNNQPVTEDTAAECYA